MPIGLRSALPLILGVVFLPFASPLLAATPDLSKGRPLANLDARIGPNVRLGDDPGSLPSTQRGQAEPHLIRSAANPDLLLATFQEGRYSDAGSITCGYAVSRDGGLTWRRSLVPNLATVSGGRFNRATDPVAGAGPQGDLYLQSLGSTVGAFTFAAIVVSRSTDGGDTWSAPVTVFESATGTPSPDKNWLAVNDLPGTPTSGRLVSTWTAFIRNNAGVTTSAHLLASVSDDRGVTWTPPTNITPIGSLQQGSQPVFLPDGSLGVVYITFFDVNDITTINLSFKRSLDGGRSFPATPTTIAPFFTAWDDPQMRDGVFLPAAAAARQSGALFVSYVALQAGTPRVLVRRSTDLGGTWSEPTVASDQPLGVSVMNPAIAASPDGQTVSVFFMDKRNAPHGRDLVDFYVALSFDGGVTWQPNLRVSELSSEIRYGPPTTRGAMLGDYFALAPSYATDQPCVAIWCDTRTGDSDPFVARFAPRPAPTFDAWRLAHFSRAELAATASLATSDPDGDGMDNQREFLFGGDPHRVEYGEIAAIVEQSSRRSLAWQQRGSESASAFSLVRLGGDGTAAMPAAGDYPETDPGAELRWQSLRLEPGTPSQLEFQTYRDAAVGTTTRLVNLATRGRSGPSASPLIVGFVLDGNKSMLVRAAGPALNGLGVANALPNPRLLLEAPASDLERSNDNWNQGGASADLFSRLGAFPFSNGSLDAALLLSLGAQSYTAAVTDATGASGITLVEAYDADPVPGSPTQPRLLNLSTRGEVGGDDTALIAGFVLAGQQPRRILLRAVGPGLTPFGLSGTLPDPQLTLFRNDTRIASNDDWELGRSSAAISLTAQRLGAFPLARASLDAALLITLAPGAYTVVVTSADGRTGITLVEVYDAD